MKRNYYRYLGNLDGSGCPYGIVYKCYTDEEYERFRKFCRLVPEGKTSTKAERIKKAKQSLAIAALICGVLNRGYGAPMREGDSEDVIW